MILKDFVGQLQIWNDWRESYNEFVPKFIEAAKTNESFGTWIAGTFLEFFEQARDQCVSSLQQGYFTNEEKEAIKANWDKLAPLFKTIAESQETMDLKVYKQIVNEIRKCTSKNRSASTNRLIASLQPQLLCTVVNEKKLNHLIDIMNSKFDNCSISKKDNWFVKSNKVLNYYVKELDQDPMQIMTLPWQTYDHFTTKSKSSKQSNFMDDDPIQTTNNISMQNLNTILYGPPGTGKTYSTIDKVVSICSPEDYKSNDHISNKVIYDDLIKEGRVVFTTFHQSVAYEDFIEGIKPVKAEQDDTFLKYDIEPGIFKQIANNSKSIVSKAKTSANWENVNYYKMSIGGKHRPDLHDWCIENSVVGLGWGGDEDLSKLVPSLNEQGWPAFRDNFKQLFPETADDGRYHIQAAFIFMKMKIGDIVVISKGNHIIDAIGKITGEYYFDDQTPTSFYHYRKIEWIATNMDASPEKFIEKQISQQSIYEFYSGDIKKEAFVELTSGIKHEDKPYAIIIDEINRGNISAIFGELITLIEEDKRIGAKNEIKVTLPYSKEKFGVPSNLHIIGTMNTADRSVEALDTALRRRFSFVEMMPNPELLKDEKGNVLEVEATNGKILLPLLLKTINERIEVLVDRDHTIGHAYFMNVRTLEDLKNTFHKNIIPLLQEYFYGNYEKMELVIGGAFFEKTKRSTVKFAAKNSDFSFDGDAYRIRDISKMDPEDFSKALFGLLNEEIES